MSEPLIKSEAEVCEADCHSAACGKRSNYALAKGDEVSGWALPYKNCDGSINKACLRAALARWNQVQGYSSGAKKAALAKLRRAAKSVGMEVNDKEYGLPPDPIFEKFFFTAPITEVQKISEEESPDGPMMFIRGRAINATTTLNNLTYPPAELHRAAPTLEGRNVFKDHLYTTESVVGRVVTSVFKQNGIDYDAALMKSDPVVEKIELGLIDKVSIGAKVEDITCSLCGESVGMCNHVVGREYDGVLATGVVHGLTFIELSLVPFPGDESTSIDVSHSLDEVLIGKIRIAESARIEEGAPSITHEVETRMSEKNVEHEQLKALQAEKVKLEEAAKAKDEKMAQMTEQYAVLQENAKKRLVRDIVAVEKSIGKLADEEAVKAREEALKDMSIEVLEGIHDTVIELEPPATPPEADSQGVVGETPPEDPAEISREQKKDIIRQFFGFDTPVKEARKTLRKYNPQSHEWAARPVIVKEDAE